LSFQTTPHNTSIEIPSLINSKDLSINLNKPFLKELKPWYVQTVAVDHTWNIDKLDLKRVLLPSKGEF
jgi:hypothetical protein